MGNNTLGTLFFLNEIVFECIYHLIWEVLTFILHDEKISEKVWSPNVGLEPTTLRLRVSCSTN